MTEHVPDISKIPIPLQSLKWEAMDTMLAWADGSELLVAAAVCSDPKNPEQGWYYELSVVTLRLDDDSFDVELHGEPWYWDFTEIDVYVLLRGNPPCLLEDVLDQ